MKKTLIIISLWFMQVQVSSANDQVMAVRNLFYSATVSSDSADVFLVKMQALNKGNSAFIIGYEGMAHLMICYHSFNPYAKWKNFVKGKSLIEKAIEKDSTNIELRFLRLSVQLNTPSFLSYSSNINEDKAYIFKNISLVSDEDLFKRIYNYTLQAKKITQEEKNTMKQALAKNQYAKATTN